MADDHTAGSREKLADNYFHDMYRDSDDPWGFTSRWYEQRKYALSLAALSSPRYGSVFEPGCSVGVLSAQLATRADHLLCTDVSPRAVELARERLDGHDSVEVRVGDIVSVRRGDWGNPGHDKEEDGKRHGVKRGKFGVEGRVLRVDGKSGTLYVEGVGHSTADGKEEGVPIHPSNVVVTKVDEGDPIRLQKLQERIGGDE